MDDRAADAMLEKLRQVYPDKFAPEEQIFRNIHPGSRIFIGTACAEPEHLVSSLVNYVESNPKAFLMPRYCRCGLWV